MGPDNDIDDFDPIRKCFTIIRNCQDLSNTNGQNAKELEAIRTVRKSRCVDHSK